MSSFFFILDISGSMYGQKIAAANAALTESLDVLRGMNEAEDLCVSLAVFHEQMELLLPAEAVEGLKFPYVLVEPGPDGFYPTTSYACLCRGLQEMLKNGVSWDYLFLITDGKPVDEGAYAEEQEALKACHKACTYVVLTEEDSGNLSRELVHFADDRIDQVIGLSDLSSELSKIGLTFYHHTEGAEENAKFAEIFGD